MFKKLFKKSPKSTTAEFANIKASADPIYLKILTIEIILGKILDADIAKSTTEQILKKEGYKTLYGAIDQSKELPEELFSVLMNKIAEAIGENVAAVLSEGCVKSVFIPSFHKALIMSSSKDITDYHNGLMQWGEQNG